MTQSDAHGIAVKIMESRAPVTVRLKDNAGTQGRYGVHAGQEVWVHMVHRAAHSRYLVMEAECEDEHLLRLRPSDAELVSP